MSGIIAVKAVIAMVSVLLVFQMGCIWMSMSRDGLLTKKFLEYIQKSACYRCYRFVAAVPVLFLNSNNGN
jgi:hypothetical protein